MKISPSKEDYIKTIYSLNGAKDIVSNKQLAHSLSVSAASVTDMNNRLKKENLITYYPYKGVQLTDIGIQIANKLIRKHRIWEVFLYEKLGFDWDEVHVEADRLEHASSEKVINALSELLGHPEYDPHGGIIPNADGTVDLDKVPLIPLKDAIVSQIFTVKEVPDDDDELLSYLTQKGFSLNDTFEIIHIETYDSTITIKNTQTDVVFTISGKALENIRVELLTS
ncbi:MAG TPA: metal-dependent transcriptional regulator [Atopostipes sp.]|nr:metal-dependent transcriptional regulator [Atopostipes sp.]